MLKSKLAAAVLVALAFGYADAYAGSAIAAPQEAQSTQDNSTQGTSTADSQKAKKLEAVTVTGSLIPQVQVETSKPVITITAQQLKDRGFATVADALQQGTFATGSVQGANNSGGFTQSAKKRSASLASIPATQSTLSTACRWAISRRCITAASRSTA